MSSPTLSAYVTSLSGEHSVNIKEQPEQIPQKPRAMNVIANEDSQVPIVINNSRQQSPTSAVGELASPRPTGWEENADELSDTTRHDIEDDAPETRVNCDSIRMAPSKLKVHRWPTRSRSKINRCQFCSRFFAKRYLLR